MGRIFGSPEMGILPPLPILPDREGDNGLFSSISSSFRPIVGLSGAGGVAAAAAVKSFHSDSVERSGEPGSCSLLSSSDRPTKAKREKRERENGLLVRSPVVVDPPATLISEEQTSFLGIVSRAQAASAQRVFARSLKYTNMMFFLRP